MPKLMWILLSLGISLLFLNCELNRTTDEGITDVPIDGIPDGDNGLGLGPYDELRIACVNRINEYRATENLYPLERWKDGEDCADEQAEYDYNANTAHAGFRDDICNGGWAQNECPGWGSLDQVVSGCLEMMWNEKYTPSGEQGHYLSMSSKSYKKVACGFYEAPNGKVWAVQNFTNP